MPNTHKFTLSLPLFLLLVALGFLFRLAYGLCSEIWFIDQQQIYLIGLKYYSTGLWPYFGPDVSGGIQLPGALQGLVVGLPLKLLPIPEAPYILLNLLSFAGLCLLGWYTCKRLPNFPRWFLWGWVFTAPWVLNWSTNIDNDSYMLVGACLFFVGFIETIPTLTIKAIPTWLANFFMGLALGWCAQFHMSYVILIPFALISLGLQLNVQKTWVPIASFVVGSLATYSFVIPTWVQYGLAGSGNTASAVTFNPDNITSFLTLLFRYLCLACEEVPRFLGANTDARLTFLKDNLWVAPFAVIAAVLGLLQLFLLFAGFFLKNNTPKWKDIRLLTIITLMLVYVSFIFAIKAPAAHTFYLTLPVVMIYGFYVLNTYTHKKWFTPLAVTLLVCNIVLHAGIALHNLPVKSLYKDRGTFVKAIQEKNYQVLGERRPNTLY